MSTQDHPTRRGSIAVPIVVGGLLFGLSTMIVILPTVFAAGISANLHISAAEATLFATLSTFGDALGNIEIIYRGRRIGDRRRYLLQRGLISAAILVSMPLLIVRGGIIPLLVATFAAAWLIPFDPIVRPLLGSRLAVAGERLKGVLQWLFLFSLFFDRIPLKFVADRLGSPWWGMGAGGVALATVVLIAYKVLPHDPAEEKDDKDDKGGKDALRAMWSMLRTPDVLWGALLGGVAGTAYAVIDGTNSFALTEHHWGNLVQYYGVTSLLAGIASALYGGFAHRNRRVALIISSFALVVGFLALLPSIAFDGHSFSWLIMFGVGASIILIAANWNQVILQPIDDSAKSASWNFLRILSITVGVQLGGVAITLFSYPGTVWVGGAFAILGVVLLPFAMRQMGLQSDGVARWLKTRLGITALEQQVSELKTTDEARVAELETLKVRVTWLEGKIVVLERLRYRVAELEQLLRTDAILDQIHSAREQFDADLRSPLYEVSELEYAIIQLQDQFEQLLQLMTDDQLQEIVDGLVEAQKQLKRLQRRNGQILSRLLRESKAALDAIISEDQPWFADGIAAVYREFEEAVKEVKARLTSVSRNRDSLAARCAEVVQQRHARQHAEAEKLQAMLDDLQ